MSKRPRTSPPAATPPGGTGRRDRSVTGRRDSRSFLVRHRTATMATAIVAVVAIVTGVVLFQSTQKLYACSEIWRPAATDSAGGQLGVPQNDEGNQHIDTGASHRYPLCPPASGPHYGSPGGPIAARFHDQNDQTLPQGWIHNLEHGGLVILYSCTQGGCDTADQDRLQQLVASFPNSPVCGIPAGTESPVVTRFEEMAHRFAAIVWDRVLFQDTLDTDQILKFYATEGERTNPEPQCQPSAAPSSAAPSPAPSAAPSAAPSPSPS